MYLAQLFRKYLPVLALLLVVHHSVHAQFIERYQCKVYFDTDIDELNFEAKGAIREAILNLNGETIKEIYISGHADSDASDAYNIDLSRRRAENARDFLLSQGVKSRMLKLEAFGEREPISDDKSLNRRVDIVFIYEIFTTPVTTTGNGARVIQGNVYDANTKEPLPASFAIEIDGRNNFKRTNKKGYFRLRSIPKRKLELVFSRTGYWSESIKLSQKQLSTSQDTISLKIYLKPIEVREKMSFKNIYFYTDTDRLKPDSKPDLDLLLEFMQKDSDARIEIQGHMNFPIKLYASPMQVLYNRALSHNRAKAVYTHLVKNGIDPNRMTYKGMSNFRMVYPDPKSPEEEDANKRVEAWVLEWKDKSASN